MMDPDIWLYEPEFTYSDGEPYYPYEHFTLNEIDEIYADYEASLPEIEVLEYDL